MPRLPRQASGNGDEEDARTVAVLSRDASRATIAFQNPRDLVALKAKREWRKTVRLTLTVLVLFLAVGLIVSAVMLGGGAGPGGAGGSSEANAALRAATCTLRGTPTPSSRAVPSRLVPNRLVMRNRRLRGVGISGGAKGWRPDAVLSCCDFPVEALSADGFLWQGAMEARACVRVGDVEEPGAAEARCGAMDALPGAVGRDADFACFVRGSPDASEYPCSEHNLQACSVLTDAEGREVLASRGDPRAGFSFSGLFSDQRRLIPFCAGVGLLAGVVAFMAVRVAVRHCGTPRDDDLDVIAARAPSVVPGATLQGRDLSVLWRGISPLRAIRATTTPSARSVVVAQGATAPPGPGVLAEPAPLERAPAAARPAVQRSTADGHVAAGRHSRTLSAWTVDSTGGAAGGRRPTDSPSHSRSRISRPVSLNTIAVAPGAVPASRVHLSGRMASGHVIEAAGAGPHHLRGASITPSVIDDAALAVHMNWAAVDFAEGGVAEPDLGAAEPLREAPEDSVLEGDGAER
ncbi:unnamed protein product [Pedinophyceae sp. YPF-701]|nr:unnamed protein product [Pedinophyceae sp. YPF-701]